MERDGFVFYKSFITGIDTIPDAVEQLKAYKYIIKYGIYGEEPEEGNSIAYGFFAMAKPQIDANNKRFIDGQKGGAPVGNQNARKNWDTLENGEKQLKQPQVDIGKQLKQPKEKDKEKDKDKEKGYGGRLDAEASRGNIKDAVGEKNKSMTLNEKLKDLGLEDEVIELAIVYNGCKKGKKLDKFKDAQLKIRVSKLRKCGFDSIEGMKQVLENSIAGGYEGIFELKTKPIPSSIPIQGGVVKVGNSNIFL